MKTLARALSGFKGSKKKDTTRSQKSEVTIKSNSKIVIPNNVDYRKALELLYTRYDSKKLADLDQILRNNDGEEDFLFVELMDKHSIPLKVLEETFAKSLLQSSADEAETNVTPISITEPEVKADCDENMNAKVETDSTEPVIEAENDEVKESSIHRKNYSDIVVEADTKDTKQIFFEKPSSPSKIQSPIPIDKPVRHEIDILKPLYIPDNEFNNSIDNHATVTDSNIIQMESVNEEKIDEISDDNHEVEVNLAIPENVDYHKMLQLFYSIYNPKKVNKIDNLVNEYHGREEELINLIWDKYDVDINLFQDLLNKSVLEETKDSKKVVGSDSKYEITEDMIEKLPFLSSIQDIQDPNVVIELLIKELSENRKILEEKNTQEVETKVKMNALKVKKKDLEEKLKVTHDKLSEIKSEADNIAAKRIESLEIELQALSKAKEETDKRKRDELLSVMNEKSNLQKELYSLQTELVRINLDVQEKTEENNRLNEIAKKQRQRDAKRQKIDIDLRTSSQEESNRSMQSLLDKIQSLGAEIQEKDRQIYTKEQTLEVLRGEKETLQAELNSSKDSHEIKIMTLQNTIRELNSQVSIYSMQSKGFEAENDKLAKVSSELLDAKVEEINKVKTKLMKVKEVLHKKNEEIKKLELDLSSSQSSLRKAEVEKSFMGDNSHQNEEELVKAQQLLKSVSVERDSLVKELTELKSDLKVTKYKFSNLKKQCQKEDNTMRTLQKDLEQSDGELHKTESILMDQNALVDCIKSLRLKLKAKTRDLEVANLRIMELMGAIGEKELRSNAYSKFADEESFTNILAELRLSLQSKSRETLSLQSEVDTLTDKLLEVTTKNFQSPRPNPPLNEKDDRPLSTSSARLGRYISPVVKASVSRDGDIYGINLNGNGHALNSSLLETPTRSSSVKKKRATPSSISTSLTKKTSVLKGSRSSTPTRK